MCTVASFVACVFLRWVFLTKSINYLYVWEQKYKPSLHRHRHGLLGASKNMYLSTLFFVVKKSSLISHGFDFIKGEHFILK